MGRTSKAKHARQNNIQIARKCTKRNIQRIELQIVVATLIAGITWTQAAYFMTLMETDSPLIKPAKFYSLQNKVGQLIIACAHKNIEKYRNKMSNQTVISIDGSWDHRRNGKFCLVEAFDLEQGKIIDYEVIERSSQNNSDESFYGPSNQMEIEGVKKIVARLNSTQKIIGYVHDQDSKTSNFIREHWNITEYIDVNHARKSLANYLDRFRFKDTTNKKVNILRGVKKNILSYYDLLIHSNLSAEEKVEQWFNAVEHYNGNHTKCMHKPYRTKEEELRNLPKWARSMSSEKSDALRKCLNDTLKYLRNVNPKYTTQINEALHGVKAKMARKDVAWGGGWRIRMALAVLKVNEPTYWIELILRSVGLGIHLGSLAKGIKALLEWIEIKKIKGKRKLEVDRIKRNRARALQIKSDRSKSSGYDFKHGAGPYSLG